MSGTVPSLLDDEPTDLSEGERETCADVERYGFSIVSVWPFEETPPEWRAWEHVPAWHYTVGLWRTYRHPELVAFGLEAETAAAVFWDLADGMAAGRTFVPGRVYDDALPSFGGPCAFESVDGGWAEPLFGQARWFYKGQGFPIIQYLWRDRFGRWIWEPEAADSIREVQPDLTQSPPEPDAPPVLPRV